MEDKFWRYKYKLRVYILIFVLWLEICRNIATGWEGMIKFIRLSNMKPEKENGRGKIGRGNEGEL